MLLTTTSLLFLFTFCFSQVRGCSLIQTELDFQILGKGFHRRLSISANLSSSQRLVSCQLIYQFQIPVGAYLDVDSLNRQFDPARSSRPVKHCLTSSHFDVEKPHGPGRSAQPSPVFFHSNKIPLKSFLLSDQLEFPVHLRYHSPVASAEEDFATVEFEQPHIFIRCEQNNGSLLNEPSCRQRLEKVPCECKQPKAECPAFRLRSTGNEEILRLKAQVPVGNEQMAVLVTLVTNAVVLVGTSLVIWAAVSSGGSTIGEDAKKRR